MDEYLENGEWVLPDTDVENREYKFPDKSVPFPYVRYEHRFMFCIE